MCKQVHEVLEKGFLSQAMSRTSTILILPYVNLGGTDTHSQIPLGSISSG